MKEEEQEQQALASAEDLSQEASATDSTASAASGEKTLAANTAGENEPEKTEEALVRVEMFSRHFAKTYSA